MSAEIERSANLHHSDNKTVCGFSWVRTLIRYAEAEQWRVAIGESIANSQKPTVNIQRLLSKNFRKPLNIQKTLRTFAPLL